MMEDVNDSRLRLLAAIEHDRFDEAKSILEEYGHHKELLEPFSILKISAIHLAAWKGRVDLLNRLVEMGANINAKDKIGRCALFYAADRGHLEVTQWLLERRCYVEPKIGVDTCTRQCFLIHDYKTQEFPVGQNLPVTVCCGRTPLHQAVENNHSEIVRILVRAGANVNARDDNQITALLLAGCKVDPENVTEMKKYVAIVDVLIEANALVDDVYPQTGKTALHQATTLGSPRAVKRLIQAGAWPFLRCSESMNTPLHIAAADGHLEILQILLSHATSDDVNFPNKIGQTALHMACFQDHVECAKALIDHGGDLSIATKSGVTVIDVAFAHVQSPISFLTDIMDARVRVNDGKTLDTHTEISVDFSVLVPRGEVQTNVIIALITATSSIEELAILRHPLIETFVQLKWAKLRLFFFFFFLIQAFYVLSLSVYAVLLLRNNDSLIARNFLTTFSTILLFHTTAQVIMIPRHYIRQLETWLSFVSAIISFVISTFVVDSRFILFGFVYRLVQSNPEWKIHAISIANLLAWIHTMLLIGRFPTWGHHALMFSTVLKNVLKVLLAFVCMIVGFAFSFAILFHKNEHFHGTCRALVKTVVMMMGEYDYDDLFPDKTDENSTPFLTVISRIVFLSFVVLASMVLMNLMIGLAVNDIQSLEKEGHIRRLLRQTEFVVLLEQITSSYIFRYLLLLPWFRRLVEIRRVVPKKMVLRYRDRHPTHGISPALVESLYLLATRNCERDERKLYRTAFGDPNVRLWLANIEKELQQLRRLRCHSLPRLRNKLFEKRIPVNVEV